MNWFERTERLETCDDCGNDVPVINYHDDGRHILLVDRGFYCPKCAVLVVGLLKTEGFLR